MLPVQTPLSCGAADRVRPATQLARAEADPQPHTLCRAEQHAERSSQTVGCLRCLQGRELLWTGHLLPSGLHLAVQLLRSNLWRALHAGKSEYLGRILGVEQVQPHRFLSLEFRAAALALRGSAKAGVLVGWLLDTHQNMSASRHSRTSTDSQEAAHQCIGWRCCETQ